MPAQAPANSKKCAVGATAGSSPAWLACRATMALTGFLSQNVWHPLQALHPQLLTAGRWVRRRQQGIWLQLYQRLYLRTLGGKPLFIGQNQVLLSRFQQRYCQCGQSRDRWQPGDVKIRHNWATWRKGTNDCHGFRRAMHRVTVQGCAISGTKDCVAQTLAAPAANEPQSGHFAGLNQGFQKFLAVFADPGLTAPSTVPDLRHFMVFPQSGVLQKVFLDLQRS